MHKRWKTNPYRFHNIHKKQRYLTGSINSIKRPLNRTEVQIFMFKERMEKARTGKRGQEGIAFIRCVVA